jgi:hypothetical protein
MSDEIKTPETEELRRDIAETREELGETVAALTAKANVKSHAKVKVAERREKLHIKQQQVKAKVGGVGQKVGLGSPGQAREPATHLTKRAKERPVPTAAAGSLLVGFAIGWVLARR